MTLWHCWPTATRILTPARRASRTTLPIHPARPRTLRRFRHAAAAVPAGSGVGLVCVRVAALAVPLALGPAALPAAAPRGPSLPFVGFGPIISGAAYAPLASPGRGVDGLADDLPPPALADARRDGGGTAGGVGGPSAGDGAGDLTPTTVPEPAGIAALLAALTFTLIARRPAR